MTAPQELVLAVAGRIQKEKAQRGGWESKQRGGMGWQKGSGMCSITTVTEGIISLPPMGWISNPSSAIS